MQDFHIGILYGHNCMVRCRREEEEGRISRFVLITLFRMDSFWKFGIGGIFKVTRLEVEFANLQTLLLKIHRYSSTKFVKFRQIYLRRCPKIDITRMKYLVSNIMHFYGYNILDYQFFSKLKFYRIGFLPPEEFLNCGVGWDINYLAFREQYYFCELDIFIYFRLGSLLYRT